MSQPAFKIGLWTFKPGLMSSLTTLLILLLFVYLGFWQLERADQKQILENLLASRLSEPVLNLEALPALYATATSSKKKALSIKSSTKPPAIDNIRYRQLKVTGTFLNNQQILLDNQIYQGTAGYHVITPFLIQNSQTILLVNRGWIPIGKNRHHLPNIPAIEGTKTLIGTINQAATGLQLKDIPIGFEKWPICLQAINFEKLASVFTEKLYPFLLQLPLNDPLGFKIEPITFNMKAQRHLGYAIQWFTMALAVLVYFMVINTKRSTYDKK